MPRRYFRHGFLHIFTSVWMLMLFCQQSIAQAETAPDSNARDEKTVAKQSNEPESKPSVKEVEPKVFYLKDKDGKLRPVINFTYEEFLRLQKLSTELKPKKPKYHLTNYQVRAVAKGKYVHCQIQIEIETYVDQWVVVPLGMRHSILDADSQFLTSSKSFLRRKSNKSGYEAVIQATAGKKHQLKLSVRSPITKSGQWTSWKFDAPMNTKGDQPLVIVLPIAKPEVMVFSALLDEEKSGKVNKDGSSEHLVLGIGPDMEITWHHKVAEKKRLEAVLEVNVVIDQDTVRMDTKIQVSKTPEKLQQIKLKMPSGFVLEQSEQQDYTVQQVEESGNRFAIVKFKAKAVESLQLSFISKRSSNQTIFDLGDIEFIGADRQTGYINVSVVGNWRIDWKRKQGVRELEVDPKIDSQPLKKYLKRFEVFNFPCSLAIRISPQRTRISVQATHQALVMLDRIEMISTLQYKIRGAKATKLYLEMHNWQIEDILPAGIVQGDAELVSKNNIVEIPLSTATSGELTLTVRSTIKMKRTDSEQSFLIPRPIAETSRSELQQHLTITSDKLSIQPINQVGIQVNQKKCLHLTPEPSEKIISSKWQQPALVFHIQSEKQSAKMVVQISELQRRISAKIATHLHVQEEKTLVDQNIDFQIHHQTADALVLHSAMSLLNMPQYEILLNDQPVSKQQVVEKLLPQTPKITQKIYQLRIALLQPAVGKMKLTIRYSKKHELPPTDKYEQQENALFLPQCDQLLQNELIIQVDPTLHFSTTGKQWIRDDRNSTVIVPESVNTAVNSVNQTLQFIGSDQSKSIQFQISRKPRSTDVQLLWTQTWMGPSGYHARVVYQFRSDQRQIHLRFPKAINPSAVSYLLNHSPIRSEVVISPHDDFEVSIDLASLAPPLSAISSIQNHHLPQYVLELRYAVAMNSNPSRPTFVIPTMIGNVRVLRSLWQVVLSDNQYLMQVPAGVQPEYDWSWKGIYWTRVPRLLQADLEKLTGTGKLQPLPENANQYLLSLPGAVSQLEIHIVPRWRLVMYASSATLLFGLIVLYFPKIRHPLVLLSMSLAILAMAMIVPSIATIVAQAAILGISLLLMACFMKQWQVKKQTSRQTVVHGARSSIMEKPSSTASISGVDGSSRQTTISGPIKNYEASALDSER